MYISKIPMKNIFSNVYLFIIIIHMFKIIITHVIQNIKL
jgi:hypothetical protein